MTIFPFVIISKAGAVIAGTFSLTTAARIVYMLNGNCAGRSYSVIYNETKIYPHKDMPQAVEDSLERVEMNMRIGLAIQLDPQLR